MRRTVAICAFVFLTFLAMTPPRATARPEGDRERFGKLISASVEAFNAKHLFTAMARVNEAVVEGEKAFGPDHSQLAAPLTYLAVAHYQIGDNEQAKTILGRARAIRDKNRKDVLPQISKMMDDVWKRLERPLSYDSKIKPGAVPTDFKGKGLDGKPIALKDYAGKVVLVDFWATWCPPCREEIPSLVMLHKKFAGKGFEILGVSLDGPEQKKIAGFTQQNGMVWRHVYDGGGWEAAVSRKYGVRSIPFTVLIGKDGKIIAVGADAELLNGLLEETLGN